MKRSAPDAAPADAGGAGAGRSPGRVSPRADILATVRETAPVSLAAVPIGLAFGVLVTHAGLAWWWATLFASIIFAGSLEFLVLGLVSALAPLSQIAVTAFAVNFRHVLYALSFPLDRVHGPAAKAYSTFALTDEAYALTSRPQARTYRHRHILTLQVAFHLIWVASVTVGAVAGTFLPAGLVGLDFAITALFLVLGIDALRAGRDVPALLVAAACALLAYQVSGDQMLAPAMIAFVGFLLVRHRLGSHRHRLPSPQRSGRTAPDGQQRYLDA